ncbi:DUF1365 domain-containing protein [Marinobacter caseinilyticus]|uniref:DUF1365 domain-containing protein n=1 Tax=Marinobacter caseinilyticus TaxID=2692195 RepID=UPI001408BE2F|nr:DUF1365 domain-containing protein [Marinobacter caseinilyticus]
MTSQWLEGTVRHRRLTPVSHEFLYRTGMLALNLKEWTDVPKLSRWFSLERFNWLSLCRRDYFKPEATSLKDAVCDQVEQATGWRPDGDIELITHPRYLGYVFNPVSFYFCYAPGDNPQEGAVPRVIAAQITNTPWHERHLYCLESGEGRETKSGWHTQSFSFQKRFHVSPYNPMDQHYRWLFAFRDNELRIHMNVLKNDQKIFDATLEVQRVPLTRKSLHRSLRQFPLESFKVVVGIYWHALRLKLKGAEFQTHPDKLDHRDPSYRLGSSDHGERVDEVQQPNNNATKVSSWRT